MPSVKSYFNKSLFRGTLSRTWPLWAAYTLAWLLIMPVWLFTMLSRYHIGYSRITVSYDILNMSINAGIAAAAFSGICFAMAMFSYLSNSRATYGMHTMPIRREGLFLTHYLAGLFAQVVTLVLAYALAALVAACHGVFDAYAIGMGLVINLLLVLFFYSFGVLCMVCAGQILAGAAFYGIFNFLFIAMEALVQTFAGNFLYGYVPQSNFSAMVLSPLFQLYSRLGASKIYPPTIDGGVQWDAEPLGVEVQNFRYVALYALAGVILAVIALTLYRKRKSEATGSTVAVTWLRPVFKYSVALCSAFSFGQLLSYFVFELTESNYEVGALVGTIACMVFAGLLGYYAAEMLLKKSFRVFRGNWRGFIAVAVICTAFVICCDADVFGVEGCVPDADDIEKVVIEGYDVRYEASTEFDEILALHRAIIADRDKYERINVDAFAVDRGYEYFEIRYHLKSGRVVSREYDLVYDLKTGDPNVTSFRTIVNRVDAVLDRYTPSIEVNEKNIIYAGVRWDTWGEDNDGIHNSTDLTPEQMCDLYYNAVIPDIKNGGYRTDREFINCEIYISFELADGGTLGGSYNSGSYDALTIHVDPNEPLTVQWIRDNLGWDIYPDVK